MPNGYDKLIPLIVIPAMLLGQDGQLSEAARTLLIKPRPGPAQLTWIGGRKEYGYIARVTDQFVTFVTKSDPKNCENVELSQVAAVRWTPVPRENRLLRTGGIAFVGAVLSPFYAGHEVAEPFHRMFPPLKPLRGKWESISLSPGGGRSSLYFDGSTVQYQAETLNQGRYHADQDRLYMIFTGGPETVVQFHFNCNRLIFNTPPVEFVSAWTSLLRAAPPIVGNWHNSDSDLDLKRDGSFEERKKELRKGMFEMT
jgi:hypothetical protein